MKKTKFVSACLIATMLAASLVGCGGDKKTETKEEMVTLRYVMAGPGVQEDSERVWKIFNDKLQEKLPNVTVDFEVFSMSDYKQQFMLMQTSGEQIDIANMYGLDFAQEVANGTLAPMDELLTQYGADVKETLPEWLWDYMKIDGIQYGIPSYQQLSTYAAYATPTELADKYLDKEALKNALYSSDFLSDDVYKVIEDYLQKLKDNGELGLGMMQWEARKGIGEGVIGNYVVVSTNGTPEVKYQFETELIKKEYARHAEWYKKGFIREDSLSATDDNDKQGKPGGIVLWSEQYTPWAEENMTAKYGRPITLIPLSDEYFVGKDNAASGTGIMQASEHKEEAMQVLNLLQSDKELYNLLVFGLEGEHYTKVSDDRIEVPYVTGSPSANDKYGIYKWIVGNTALAYAIQTEPDGYRDWWMEDVNQSEHRSQFVGFIADTSAVADKVAQINAIKGEYQASLNSGSLDNWEKTYNEWMKKIKAAGNDEVVAELQRQVDEFLANKQ